VSSLAKKTYKFLVPANFNIYLIKSKKNNYFLLYFYSRTLALRIPLFNPKLSLHFDSSVNLLMFSSHIFLPKFYTWLKNLSTILLTFTTFLFYKIKFKGKGYYLYKNKRNTITPQFGYSHRIYFYSYASQILFVTKTKILFYGFNKGDILKVSLNVKSKRNINIFTGRGVRFSKQIIYKKTGKVSLYR
jgi:hypothetical protein